MNPSGSESSEEEQRRLSQFFWHQNAAISHQPASGSSSASVLGSSNQPARTQANSVQNPPSHSAAPAQNETPPSQNPTQANASSSDLMQMIIQLQIQMNQLMMMQKQTPPDHQSMPAPVLNPEHILDSLSSHIKEFQYDEEAKVTFAVWYARYEDLFAKDASRLDDEAKVRLLMRKLGASEYGRYANFILLRNTRDFSFQETVSKLTSLFSNRESLLSKRYKCLNTIKARGEDARIRILCIVCVSRQSYVCRF